MSIYLEQDGSEECVFENASRLDVSGDRISVSTLFEEPVQIQGVRIQSIDFLAGKVMLKKERTRREDGKEG